MDVSTIEDALARLAKRHGAVRAKEIALLDKVQQALAQAQAVLEAERQAELAEQGRKEAEAPRAEGAEGKMQVDSTAADADVTMEASLDDLTKPTIPSASLSSNPRCRTAVSSLVSRLGSLGPEKELAGLHKELHGAVARLSKAVEREKDRGTFVADIGGAYREGVQFDPVIVKREIAKHLYREGLFDIGDGFVREAGLGVEGEGEGRDEEEDEEGEVKDGEEEGDVGEGMEEEGKGKGKGKEKGKALMGAEGVKECEEADVEAGRGGGGGGGGARAGGGGALWGEGRCVSGQWFRAARLSWSARRRGMGGSRGGGGGSGGAGIGGAGCGLGDWKEGGGTGSRWVREVAAQGGNGGGSAAGEGGEARSTVGGVGEGVSLKWHRERYATMHAILHAIRTKDLGSALAWAAQHREELQREVAGGFPVVKVGGGGNGEVDGGEGDGGKGVVEVLKTSSLEFEIHRLQFLNLMQEQQRQLLLQRQEQQHKGGSFFMSDATASQTRPATSAALRYARQHFPPFAATHLPDIQRLMAALLWIGRLESSPYANLLPLTAAHWDEIAARFTSDYCAVECQESAESPLAVVVAAGGEALPMLTKLAALLKHSSGIGGRGGATGGSSITAAAAGTGAATALATFGGTAAAAAGAAAGASPAGSSSRRARRDWQCLEQLPVEIELSRAFHFHSIFACPVSREPASLPDNPPVLLPCGHVVCRLSVLKLAKGATRPFKCPYCPLETTPLDCRPIHF